MNSVKIVAIVLIVAGILGLVYGSFSYTKETHEAKLGPIEVSVKDKETVNIPVWAGVKRAMLRALSAQPDLSGKFMTLLLDRNIRLEEDLCDQLFNQSEKRLARVLLKLSRLGESENGPVARIPNLSHETLAEMVGTTRSRVTRFMNKFRRIGMVEYKQSLPGHVVVKTERLTDVVLQD